jgi:hypothetical protein
VTVRAKRLRIYLHGDIHDRDPSIAWCSRCDVFARAEHFDDDAHRTSNRRRVAYSRLRFARRADPIALYRPRTANNLFEAP